MQRQDAAHLQAAVVRRVGRNFQVCPHQHLGRRATNPVSGWPRCRSDFGADSPSGRYASFAIIEQKSIGTPIRAGVYGGADEFARVIVQGTRTIPRPMNVTARALAGASDACGRGVAKASIAMKGEETDSAQDWRAAVGRVSSALAATPRGQVMRQVLVRDIAVPPSLPARAGRAWGVVAPQRGRGWLTPRPAGGSRRRARPARRRDRD